jgi:lysophospholipase L1-like esterase
MRKVLILLALFAGLLSFQLTIAQNPCYQNSSFRVVILGSSTAAGTGPSSSDSTWVNRYRKCLQALNPANEVINLAVGGFTTYRVMPNEFISPIGGRPALDTNRNITEALSRNPDVIIVNLPSNDRQFPMSEQLNNFDSLWRMSWNAGVPMYIATTQPLGTTSSATYQYQVHDSILATYGNYAIEFYDPLADTANVLLPAYNSGDNVHLNNAGHRVLWQQVMDKGIQDSFLTVSAFPDISADAIEPLFDASCADSLVGFRFKFSNLGSIASWSFDFEVQSTDTTGSDTYFSISPLAACSRDSFDFYLPVDQGGTMEISMTSIVFGDTFQMNDTARWQSEISPKPYLRGQLDTICVGSGILFYNQGGFGDTMLWYDRAVGGMPVAGGNSLSIPILNGDTTMYAELVNGPLVNLGDLATPYNVDRDWDGIMFDIVADVDLRLDSLAMRMEFINTYEVSILTKIGSYKGSEATAGDWSLWARDTADCPAPEALTVFNFPPIDIQAGDTLGVYFHTDQPNEDIVYTSAGAEQVHSDGQIKIISGTGITNTFGQAYFPRIVNAQAFYQYGVNYEGQCSSGRVAYTAIQEAVTVDLGTNVTAIEDSSVYISAPPGYASYRWIDCETRVVFSHSDSGLVIQGRALGDSFKVCLNVANFNGCGATDSIMLRWTIPNGISIIDDQDLIDIYPNPADQVLNVELEGGFEMDAIQIVDVSGRALIYREGSGSRVNLEVGHLARSYYVVEIESGGHRVARPFMKE